MATLPPKPEKSAPPELAPPVSSLLRPAWALLRRHGLLWLTWEQACARWMHRATLWPSVLLGMRLVSTLSDGLIWYGTFPILLMWGGPTGLHCALRLATMSGINLIVYRALKQSTGRPRPFKTCPGIRVCARTLDEYSFPSGHTLHAVAFGIVLSTYYPLLAWPLAVFALLVALSRVVLGLHYPSDVVIGGAIGAISAWATLNLF